jgi:hypothetical protein
MILEPEAILLLTPPKVCLSHLKKYETHLAWDFLSLSLFFLAKIPTSGKYWSRV